MIVLKKSYVTVQYSELNPVDKNILSDFKLFFVQLF